MKPQRIQRRRKAGFKLPPNTLCITRGSEFGNPFRIGALMKIGEGVGRGGWTWQQCHDERANDGTFVKVRDRIHAVELYREYRKRYPLSPEQIAKLKAADFIACWCPLDGQPCHGDVLIEAITPNF